MTALVVDTSALIAVLHREAGHEELGAALSSMSFVIPAPVVVEFWRVARRGQRMPFAIINRFLDLLLVNGTIAPFTGEHAHAAAVAAERHGSGNGFGGSLNMVDLMVYAVAEIEALPILCTGRDFASTDAAIHPASRVG